jgi:hypothetical protein
MKMPIFYVLWGSMANVAINNRVDYKRYMNQRPLSHFLVARSGVVDSCFSFSIIYVCQYDARGALWLIVNKTAILDVGRLLWPARMEIRKRNKDVFMVSRLCSGRSYIPRAYRRKVRYKTLLAWH